MDRITREKAQSLRSYFESRFRPSDFSKDFYADENLESLARAFAHTDSLEGVEERLADFIVHWDENDGYNNTRAVLEKAKDTFLNLEMRRVERKNWLDKFQVINPLTRKELKPIERTTDRRVLENDYGRRDANDRERGLISNAARCHIFRTPAQSRSASDDRPSLEESRQSGGCVATSEVAPQQIPFRFRRETYEEFPVGQLRGNIVRRYY